MIRIILICSCLLLQNAGILPNGIRPSMAKSSSMLATGASHLDHGGKIETKYDGFNHEMVVTLKKMQITCSGAKGLQSVLEQTCVSLAASLHCPGVQLDYVRYAKLRLIFETKDWDKRHPLEERELFVVADGERLKLGRMGLVSADVAGTRLIDVMKEVLEVSVPYETFNKIASGQVIEIKVGKTAFALQEKNVAALRDLNTRVKFKSTVTPNISPCAEPTLFGLQRKPGFFPCLQSAEERVNVLETVTDQLLRHTGA